MTAAGRTRTVDDEYAVRPFRRGDEGAFLDLYDAVFDRGSREWFEWKYVDNPYAVHVPIFVVEHEADGIVAARPQVPFRMRVDGRTVPAIRFGDTMVHEDHRRQGLFQRSTEHALEYYGDQGVVFGFNFPNDKSRPGYLKAGGEVVAEVTTAHRVQKPANLLGRDLPSPLAGALRAGTRGYLGARDAVARGGEFDVVRHKRVPSETFSELYHRRVPPHAHADRSEAFYDWRFENPDWEYDAYVASRNGEPVAGVVTGTDDPDGFQVTNVLEVMPLSGGSRRTRALDAAFARLTDDHADSDVVTAAGRTVPDSVLSRHGFLRDDRPPLSLGTTTTKMVVYDVGGDPPWTAADVDLTTDRNWLVTLSEHDTR